MDALRKDRISGTRDQQRQTGSSNGGSCRAQLRKNNPLVTHPASIASSKESQRGNGHDPLSLGQQGLHGPANSQKGAVSTPTSSRPTSYEAMLREIKRRESQPKIIQPGIADPRRSAPSPKRFVNFAELSDGSLVELVEDPRDRERTLLIIWKDGEARYAEEVEDRGQKLRPLPRKGEILPRILLPRRVQPYRSVRDLLCGLENFLSRCVVLPEFYCPLLANFVLSTWVTDRFPIAPYVMVVGPPESGKTTLLKALSLVCRRALLTADITSAAFLEACNQLSPTLLMDEAGTYGRATYLRHLLRVGTTPDLVALRKGHTYHAFGAKVISFLEIPDDPALKSRCILVPMSQTNATNLVKPTDPAIKEWAERLRARLLQFRLERYREIQPMEVSGSEDLGPRRRDLLSCLAAPSADHPLEQEFLLTFFRYQEETLREALPPPQNAVLGALFYAVHAVPGFGEDQEIMVGDVSRLTNQLLGASDVRYQVTPRGTGSALTSLGMRRRRTSQGWRVFILKEEVIRIHQLVRKHGLDDFSEYFAKAVRPCRVCQEVGIDFQQNKIDC